MAGLVPSAAGMRFLPELPAAGYKTYQIVAPLSTHFRPATCAEIDCPAYTHGFRTTVDERTDLGAGQAHYIRRDAGRRFTEEQAEDGRTVFTFEPGQKCFEPHRLRLDRPERFLVRDGDWRGNPTGQRYEHTNAGLWQEDFAEHQDRIHTLIERG